METMTWDEFMNLKTGDKVMLRTYGLEVKWIEEEFAGHDTNEVGDTIGRVKGLGGRTTGSFVGYRDDFAKKEAA